MSKSELALSFRDQIRKLREQSVQLGSQYQALAVAMCETTRAIGTLLEEARGSLNSENYHAMLQELGFSSAVTNSYLRVSRKHREPFKQFDGAEATPYFSSSFGVAIRKPLTESLKTTGLLPIPSGHAPQKSHGPPPFFSWASRTVMLFKTGWAKFLLSKPLDSWSVPEAEQFAFQLLPILKVHKQVTDWIQRQ